ncbi:MAG: response regulator transcription factor [Chloroflexota bacterium]|nr:response regulator transcription factor [Chloroflexota bacterium]
MERIKLLVVDDHNLFRQGLIRILADFETLEIVGQASDGQQAVVQVEKLAPDLVLMDLNMPVLSGPEATSIMQQRFPEIPIIILTVSERDEDLFDAIRAGARGYLLKNVGTDELLDAVQRVHAGEAIVAPSMAVRLLEEFRTLEEGLASTPESASVEVLSQREIEVLSRVAHGFSNKEIAGQLNLSQHTVKSHLRSILEKLRLRSRAHAAAYAVQAGLVRDVKPEE